MRANFIFRIRLLAGFFVFCAVALIVRLYLVQIVHGAEYRDKADSQHIAPSAHALARGSIYFTDKGGALISAATLKTGFTLAVLPNKVSDAASTFGALTAIAPSISKSDFMQKIADHTDPYEELGRRFDDATGQTLLKNPITGVRAYREQWRYYPGGTLASHEIGFLGFGAGTSTVETGQYGLERSYDAQLRKDGLSASTNSIVDLFKSVGAPLYGTAEGAGADLVTSIEPTVQAHLEDELKAYNSRWHAKIAGGIVMDPSTGAIIAMASAPTFDLNDVKGSSPAALFNPMTQGVYEFGSTMKPITMASALDSHAVIPTTTYNDTGTVTFDKKTISNFDHKARGVVPMQEILSQSLNVGIAYIVQKMGIDTARNYFTKFGITEETGIDLPSEASPLVSNLSSPRLLEYMNAGFGQGVAITPVAMARALATLANHGEVPAPHVGLELRYPGGIIKQLGWAPPRRAITSESADTVTRMLVTVVDTALQHGAVKIPEMSVAAKTGTAQIADHATGGYYTDRYLHSFFGYFPAYDAKFLVFFFAVEPVGAQYASETWTPPFIDMTKFLITYYGVPPDRAPAATPAP